MIEIKPLGSSSAGNAYYVTDGHTPLLLECGLRFKDIQRALNYRMSEIAGCLMTHHHQDHSLAARNIMRFGIDLYASAGALEAAGLCGHRAISVKAREQFRLGTWTILPFEVEHDADEPLGFLLVNKVGEKLLFATDTWYIQFQFSGLTHLLIECNYSEHILDQNIISGIVGVERKRRLLKSHFSLENMKEFIRANDMSKVKEIWLIHLSDTNSDADLFKQEVQALTGCPVYVADR
ncbi:Phosphoribosyl 1,2-cyclic phosphodiesterase [Paenibacillus uliginis N3/975]|uniref:Phosphoribosyl 1,2-cyclic phosphodiesterase n=1 Tax=Paenibacillus uliginis N3/975 TaxID=1313296 RepID=A0A1X7HJZ4_9BACL|nr:MBL fold metallo-hydrolase [Paenibacillus uliginis]SMF88071.1 Phosphoribosyl 1,2-cyclic phosphodiesterase [Paenibacillus uliginis N3/975]